MRDNQWFRIFSLMVLASCGGDGGGSGAPAEGKTGTLCERICARSQAAKCKNDAPNCEAECEDQISLTPAVCKTEERAFTACAERSKFRCDAAGEAEAVSCAKQFDAYADCFQASAEPDPGDDDDDSAADAGGAQPDAGSSQRDAATGDRCSPQADDTACDLCLREDCCAEVAACDGDCLGIFECAVACDGEECVADCVTSASPAGRQSFLTLTSCTEQHCAAACGDD